MRRLVVLTIMALALPTAALASSINFSTGTFQSGTITGTFKTSISITETGINQGTLTTITINTGTLIKMAPSVCAPGFTCYDFNGGNVTVSLAGSTVFSDSLSGGLTMKANSFVGLTAALMSNSQVLGGTAVSTLDFKGQKILSGSSDVSLASPVPEPSTLFSLAAGMIGLAGTMRRKLWM